MDVSLCHISRAGAVVNWLWQILTQEVLGQWLVPSQQRRLWVRSPFTQKDRLSPTDRSRGRPPAEERPVQRRGRIHFYSVTYNKPNVSSVSKYINSKYRLLFCKYCHRTGFFHGTSAWADTAKLTFSGQCEHFQRRERAPKSYFSRADCARLRFAIS